MGKILKRTWRGLESPRGLEGPNRGRNKRSNPTKNVHVGEEAQRASQPPQHTCSTSEDGAPGVFHERGRRADAGWRRECSTSEDGDVPKKAGRTAMFPVLVGTDGVDVPKKAGTRNADVISEIETVITWSELTSRGILRTCI